MKGMCDGNPKLSWGCPKPATFIARREDILDTVEACGHHIAAQMQRIPVTPEHRRLIVVAFNPDEVDSDG